MSGLTINGDDMGRMKELAIDQANEEKVRITSHTCPFCGKEPEIYEVSLKGYQEWIDGTVIQNALPELNADQRERLITGMCNDCWNLM